jgi:hypothetical protein
MPSELDFLILDDRIVGLPDRPTAPTLTANWQVTP